jgi:selenocysteine lyase/cysteine desulfurase
MRTEWFRQTDFTSYIIWWEERPTVQQRVTTVGQGRVQGDFMNTSRREWLAQSGLFVAASALPGGVTFDVPHGRGRSVRDDFPFADTCTYLTNAYVHPMSLSTRRAVQAFADERTFGSPATHTPDVPVPVSGIKSLFATIIGAKDSDIALVPSTMAGENLVLRGLGIPQSGGNVVTDALHFDGSLYMYQNLQLQGLDLRMVMPRDGAVHLADMERVIDKNTKLVAISYVSWLNGFKHDLRRVCDLAHANGALVYVDVIQAAGAVPLDVIAAGVDCCACASYKWLMADFGVGFLYVREGLAGHRIARTLYGYRQMDEFETHLFPGDSPGTGPVSWKQRATTASHFEVGTWSSSTIAALGHSLQFIKDFGVANIYAHNHALATRIRNELPRLGYPTITPPDAYGNIVSFQVRNRADTETRLRKANVFVTFHGQSRMRVSPSIYNNDADVDAFLSALS